MRKKWWKSKTLIFNGVAASLVALEASFGLLQPYMPGNVYAIASIILVMGNAILRVISAAEITK